MDDLPNTHNDKDFYKHKLQEAEGALGEDLLVNSLFMGKFTNTQASGPTSAATAPGSGQQRDMAAQTSALPSTARRLTFLDEHSCSACGGHFDGETCADCGYKS